jgi:hypothetical protein
MPREIIELFKKKLRKIIELFKKKLRKIKIMRLFS